LLLHEQVAPVRWAGVLLVSVGTALLSIGLSMWALLQVISIIGSVCGILYCSFCVLTAINFRSRKREDVGSNFTPPVSVLKPLCGVDPHACESVRSHCVRHDSDFEIILGVGNAHCRIVPAVERVVREVAVGALTL